MKIRYGFFLLLLISCNDFDVVSNGKLLKVKSHRELIDSNSINIGNGSIEFIDQQRKYMFSIEVFAEKYLFLINCNGIIDSISSAETNNLNINGDNKYISNYRLNLFTDGMKCKYLMKGKMKVYLMSTGFFSG